MRSRVLSYLCGVLVLLSFLNAAHSLRCDHCGNHFGDSLVKEFEHSQAASHSDPLGHNSFIQARVREVFKDYATRHDPNNGPRLLCPLPGPLGYSLSVAVGCLVTAMATKRSLVFGEMSTLAWYKTGILGLFEPPFTWSLDNSYLYHLMFETNAGQDKKYLDVDDLLCNDLNTTHRNLIWIGRFSPSGPLQQNPFYRPWLLELFGSDSKGIVPIYRYLARLLFRPIQSIKENVDKLASLSVGNTFIGLQLRTGSNLTFEANSHEGERPGMEAIFAAPRCGYHYMPYVERTKAQTWFVISDGFQAKVGVLQVLFRTEGAVVRSRLASRVQQQFPWAFAETTNFDLDLPGNVTILDFKSGSRLIFFDDDPELSERGLLVAAYEVLLFARTNLLVVSEASDFALPAYTFWPENKEVYVLTSGERPRCYPVPTMEAQATRATNYIRFAKCFSDKQLTYPLMGESFSLEDHYGVPRIVVADPAPGNSVLTSADVLLNLHVLGYRDGIVLGLYLDGVFVRMVEAEPQWALGGQVALEVGSVGDRPWNSTVRIKIDISHPQFDHCEGLDLEYIFNPGSLLALEAPLPTGVPPTPTFTAIVVNGFVYKEKFSTFGVGFVVFIEESKVPIQHWVGMQVPTVKGRHRLDCSEISIPVDVSFLQYFVVLTDGDTELSRTETVFWNFERI